jgi:serine/threonine protein phosphatase PrpC
MEPIMSDEPRTVDEEVLPAVESLPVKDAGTPVRLDASFHGMSITGPKRKENEDDFLIAELSQIVTVRQAKIPQPEIAAGGEWAYLFMVADGMGGHRGGGVASVQAVAEVKRVLMDFLPRAATSRIVPGLEMLEELRTAMEQANRRLLAEMGERPDLVGMGTTLTLALCASNRLYVAHVGDSRCYLFRQGRLEQLTNDHNLVAEMVRQGALTDEEAVRHPWRNVVTNILGGNQTPTEVELRSRDLEPGDALLLCTDGLEKVVGDDEIAAVLSEERRPKEGCERLIQMADERGAPDNVTVIVSRFDGHPAG